MPEYREITYTDELLADGTVHRRYSDGRQEWRARRPDGVVTWRDGRGGTGSDEPLGRHLVKRSYLDGSVIYGREGGFGRTLWGDGSLTVNRSSLRGRLGGIVAAVAGTALIGSLVMPPDALTPEQEQELRAQAQDPAGGDGGSDHYGDWDGDAGAGDWAGGGDFG